MNKIIKSLLIPTTLATAVAPFLVATSCAKDNPFEQPSIALSDTSKEIYVGQEFKLTAYINPPTLSQQVAWSSSDSNVASVDEKGNVTAIAAGNATITATWVLDQSISTQCEVVVKKLITPEYDVTIDPDDKLRCYDHGGATSIAFPFNAIGKDFQEGDYLFVKIINQKTIAGIDYPTPHKIELIDETVDVNLDGTTDISFTPSILFNDSVSYWITTFSITITPMRGSTVLSGIIGFDNLVYVSSVETTPDMFTYSESTRYGGLAITGMADSKMWEWCSTIVIPANYNEQPITEIEDNAFNEKIRILPSVIEFETDENESSNLKRIGDYAFATCDSLHNNLIIPDSVTTIGIHAFENCSKLHGDLIIPDSVTTIGECAFRDCSSLDGKLVIPDSLTEISNSAFSHCSKLHGDLIIPDSVKKIGSYAFAYCSSLDGELVISNSTTRIGTRAFEYCSSLQGKVVIPYSVEYIFERAFYKCSSLTEVEFEMHDNHSKIEVLYDYCFAYTGITMIKIPASISAICNCCFSDCQSLTYVEFLADNSGYVGLKTINEYAFFGTSMTDTSGPGGSYSFKYNGKMDKWFAVDRGIALFISFRIWHDDTASKIQCSDGYCGLDQIF